MIALPARMKLFVWVGVWKQQNVSVLRCLALSIWRQSKHGNRSSNNHANAHTCQGEKCCLADIQAFWIPVATEVIAD
jgi:hypothetical protein